MSNYKNKNVLHDNLADKAWTTLHFGIKEERIYPLEITFLPLI